VGEIDLRGSAASSLQRHSSPQGVSPLSLLRAHGHSAEQTYTFWGGSMINRLVAEVLGTFWLVFAGHPPSSAKR
jgi:hypothetical protein